MEENRSEEEIAGEENYKRLSAPFETIEEAAEVAKNFMIEVGKLRNDYHIPDVHVIIMVKGGDMMATSKAHFGDSRLAPTMLLTSLNQEFGIETSLWKSKESNAKDE